MDLALDQAGFMGRIREKWSNMGSVRKEEMENGHQVAVATTSFFFFFF